MNDAPIINLTSAPQTSSVNTGDWGSLYARLRELAARRADFLLAEFCDDSGAFDVAARSMRALMGAAEIAGRLKRYDEESADDKDSASTNPSDAEIASLARKVRAVIERDGEVAATPHGRDADASSKGLETDPRVPSGQSLGGDRP